MGGIRVLYLTKHKPMRMYMMICSVLEEVKVRRLLYWRQPLIWATTKRGRKEGLYLRSKRVWANVKSADVVRRPER